MTDPAQQAAVPDFVFICGAAGSGTTLLFHCLTRGSNVFGIHEDAFGSTLSRLILSEEQEGKCPHSVTAFVEFMQLLRRDRTLILKTPSNIRHTAALRRHLPGCRFIVMIREPHAAIASGLARHGLGPEAVARLWLNDYESWAKRPEDSLLLTFEDLVRDPASALRTIHEMILPLSPDALAFAERSTYPDRAGLDRWKTLVDDITVPQIEHWVSTLRLRETFQRLVCGR